jgi:hypothetical protein
MRKARPAGRRARPAPTPRAKSASRGKAAPRAKAPRAKAVAAPQPPAQPPAQPRARTKTKSPAASPAPAPAPSRVRRPTTPLPAPSPTEDKPYKLSAAKIRPLAEGHGACIASDKITVDGHPVRFMYREQAIHAVDSGWRFLSGLESDAYMQDAANHAFYDCNTIANYDRSIVPYLESPIGSVFEKAPGAAEFARVTDWSPLRD